MSRECHTTDSLFAYRVSGSMSRRCLDTTFVLWGLSTNTEHKGPIMCIIVLLEFLMRCLTIRNHDNLSYSSTVESLNK